MQIKDEDGCPFGAYEEGNTEEEALENILNNFKEELDKKDEWKEEDFACADPYDF